MKYCLGRSLNDGDVNNAVVLLLCNLQLYGPLIIGADFIRILYYSNF